MAASDKITQPQIDRIINIYRYMDRLWGQERDEFESIISSKLQLTDEKQQMLKTPLTFQEKEDQKKNQQDQQHHLL